MRVVVLLSLLLLSFAYTERAYAYQISLIDTAQKAVDALKNGICESRMSMSEIISEFDFDCSHIYDRLSAFIEENKEVLEMPDETVFSLKRFEEQSVYLSITECEKLVSDLSVEMSGHLEHSRIELKNRLAGVRTVIAAFFLILVILVV